MVNTEVSDNEVSSLLEVIYSIYGYDFRNYSRAHITRRIIYRLKLSRIESIDEMESRLKTDKTFASLLLSDLSITVTEMFRDPSFYKSFREKVIPILRTYSFFKVWHAGCATGEEFYSKASIVNAEGC